MKFINYLESISGIGIYPLLSLIIFLVFFAAVTIYALKADKQHIEKIKNIPFENPERD
jgi:cytochrome c oxidase cbb3-type subunit IV